MADPTKPLADKIALVTGASRGIGASIALELAKAGAHVIAVARTTGGLEELDDTIKSADGSATLVPLDIKDSDGVARLALALNERYQRLDVMVGNAGILGPLSPLAHVEPKNWDNIFAINVTANWQLIRTMDPLLRRSAAGRVVFVTSGLSWMAQAYTGAYAASKAALDAMGRIYAAETQNTNVRVNLFSPGQTRTRMLSSGWPGLDMDSVPPPEEVAKAVVPLCLPSCTETGRVFAYRSGKFLDFQAPA
jgi:NAD(P)-dependent dehydrogenase (short-subunit alcohol dehydrogenase family)